MLQWSHSTGGQSLPEQGGFPGTLGNPSLAPACVCSPRAFTSEEENPERESPLPVLF